VGLKAFFEGYPGWVAPTVAVGTALVVAYGIADVVARLVRMPLVRTLHAADGDFRSPIVRRPVRIVRAVAFLALSALFVPPALEIAGVRPAVGLHKEALSEWLLGSGLRVVLIIALAYAIVRIVATSMRRLERDAALGGGLQAIERAKRVQTLGKLVTNSVAAIVTGAALMMVLRELSIDIVPLLTGAGILGLAVGFGAQTLVKDVISGFFLIFENQIRVGDVAAINGTGGLVEAITLRTIVLRDNEGTVHVFPNGSINTLANRTKDFSYFVFDIGVAYHEDPDRVMRILREAGADLQADPVFGPNILEPLEVFGIEAFTDSAVTIRSRIKTVPLKQWDVGRELRRRVKIAFDRHGVEIPFPHRKLVLESLPPLRQPEALDRSDSDRTEQQEAR
jgi:small conductance mechanosensitive channel